MGKVHNGIALYTIEGPENLVGVYANEQPPSAGVPFPEMARKVPTSGSMGIPLVGDYDTSWFESGTQINGVINIIERSSNVYDVTWTIAGQPNPAYVGVGYILNNQFVVHYKSV